MTRALAATVAALAALSALVAVGATTGLDDWGIDHVMPGLFPSAAGSRIVEMTGLWQVFPSNVAWWEKLLDVYEYPASALASTVIATTTCAVLLRRGRGLEALVWFGAWVAANAVELTGKYLLPRPEVHWSNGETRIHVGGFDNSYPSGHSARAMVLAALVAYTWPRLRLAAVLWVLLVPVALVASGAHTISDVVGGTLLGLALVLAAHVMIRAWTLSPTSSAGSTAASWGTRSRSSPTSQASVSSSRRPS
jgi:membrane-associated phospholipid phosphatase